MMKTDLNDYLLNLSPNKLVKDLIKYDINPYEDTTYDFYKKLNIDYENVKSWLYFDSDNSKAAIFYITYITKNPIFIKSEKDFSISIQIRVSGHKKYKANIVDAIEFGLYYKCVNYPDNREDFNNFYYCNDLIPKFRYDSNMTIKDIIDKLNNMFDDNYKNILYDLSNYCCDDTIKNYNDKYYFKPNLIYCCNLLQELNHTWFDMNDRNIDAMDIVTALRYKWQHINDPSLKNKHIDELLDLASNEDIELKEAWIKFYININEQFQNEIKSLIDNYNNKYNLPKNFLYINLMDYNKSVLDAYGMIPERFVEWWNNNHDKI